MERREFVLLFIAVALFAFSARAFLYHWGNIFGIDSYWFARMGRYVLLDGKVPERDPLYSWGFEHAEIKKVAAMEIPALYYLLRFGGEYDTSKWFTVLKDLSAGAGVLGSVASGLAVYAVAGPLAGVMAGILAGTNPGYVYRSMAGFYEDDAPGMALILLGVWLFIEGMRRKKRKWLWYGLAAIAWLGVGVTWQAYELVVYFLLMTLVLYVGRIVVDEVGRRFRLGHVAGAGLAVVASLVIWIAWRMYALRTAARTMETIGYLTTNINGVGAATLLSLGIHPLAVVLAGLFSYYLTLFLLKGERTYLYISLASVVLSVPFFNLSATRGFAQTLTLSDGREVFIGYGEAFREIGGNVPGVDLYQMVFGTAALLFVVQVATAFLALLVEGERRVERYGIKEVALASVLVLSVGLLAYFYNGYLWPKDFVEGPPGILEQRASVIGATVVEERYGYFFWAPKYSILALFALFAAPFLVYRSDRKEMMFLLAVFGITLYLGWIKLKTCYYFGAPLGMVAGLVLADVWERVKEKERVRKWAFLLILTVLLSSVATGVFHTVGRIPTLLTQEEVREASVIAPIASDLEWRRGPEFLEAFEFIEKNTERNAPIFNWWGVGHWLAFFTEHPLATDNTNKVYKANRFVARTMLSEWNEAYERIKEKGYRYVFWLRDYVYATSSFALYGYGFEEGRRVAQEYTFVITNDCRKVSVGNYYNCGNNTNPFFVDASIVENAPPAYYAPLPFDLLPKIQGSYGVYRLGSRLVIVSEKMNDSLLFLLWKGGNEKFRPVFVSSNGSIVVYEVA